MMCICIDSMLDVRNKIIYMRLFVRRCLSCIYIHVMTKTDRTEKREANKKLKNPADEKQKKNKDASSMQIWVRGMGINEYTNTGLSSKNRKKTTKEKVH